MPEYIEREAVIKKLNNIATDYIKDISIQCSIAAGTVVDIRDSVIIKAPAADVVEVVHASWVWGKVCSSKGYCCTNCGAGFVGENAEWIAKEHDYCPKCGAKMDGKVIDDA